MRFMQREWKMLKNKFFLVAVGIALALALIYNISFFASRRNVLSPDSMTHSGEVALASLPPHAAGVGAEGEGTLFSPVVKPVKMVDNLKGLALDTRPWGRNPFLTEDEEFSTHPRNATGEGNKESESTTISGILIGSNRRIAIIDHTVVEEGDWVGPEQVVEIDDGKALLALGKNRRLIVMEKPPIAITVEKSEESEGDNEH